MVQNDDNDENEPRELSDTVVVGLCIITGCILAVGLGEEMVKVITLLSVLLLGSLLTLAFLAYYAQNQGGGGNQPLLDGETHIFNIPAMGVYARLNNNNGNSIAATQTQTNMCGWNTHQIAKEFGVHPEFVPHILRANYPRNPAVPRNPPPPPNSQGSSPPPPNSQSGSADKHRPTSDTSFPPASNEEAGVPPTTNLHYRNDGWTPGQTSGWFGSGGRGCSSFQPSHKNFFMPNNSIGGMGMNPPFGHHASHGNFAPQNPHHHYGIGSNPASFMNFEEAPPPPFGFNCNAGNDEWAGRPHQKSPSEMHPQMNNYAENYNDGHYPAERTSPVFFSSHPIHQMTQKSRQIPKNDGFKDTHDECIPRQRFLPGPAYPQMNNYDAHLAPRQRTIPSGSNYKQMNNFDVKLSNDGLYREERSSEVFSPSPVRQMPQTSRQVLQNYEFKDLNKAMMPSATSSISLFNPGTVTRRKRNIAGYEFPCGPSN